MKYFRHAVESFRLWLRKWLEIDHAAECKVLNEKTALHGAAISQLETGWADHSRSIAALNTGMDSLNRRDSELESLIGKTAQDLQGQITSLNVVTATNAPIRADVPTIMSGHVRFTDRKRRYETEHRRTGETSTGKQIEENSRLIAAGVRQTDETA